MQEPAGCACDEGASRRGIEPDICEVICAAIFVTLPPRRWLSAPQGMSVRQSDSRRQNHQASLSLSRIGRNVPSGKVYPSILSVDESISFSAALDLGSALRAAKPRVNMAASDLFRARCPSATLTVLRRDVLAQHRSNDAAPQSAAPRYINQGMADLGGWCDA